MTRFLFLVLLGGTQLASFAESGLPSFHRQKLTLNLDWRYHRGDVSGRPFATEHDDSAWDRVALPHTYQLTSVNLDDTEEGRDQPRFHRDISWHRRTLPLAVSTGQRVLLEFETPTRKPICGSTERSDGPLPGRARRATFLPPCRGGIRSSAKIDSSQ